jgi:hypothetical protein
MLNINDLSTKPDDYIIYSYQHIDILLFFHLIENVFEQSEKLDLYIKRIMERFTEKGWEGDGKINILWIPPFLDESEDHSYGSIVWHVKQNNDGISWLAVPKMLTSSRIVDQNKEIVIGNKIIKSSSIINIHKEIFIKQTKEVEEALDEFRNKTEIYSPLIKNAILIYAQNKLLSAFVDFLEEVYLQLLIHFIEANNFDQIKLSKINVRIDMKGMHIEDDSFQRDQALTLRMIMKNIWDNFKFLPFKEKLNEIVNSVDFHLNEQDKLAIRKHIYLRNCIQHHNSQVQNDISGSIGRNDIPLLDNNNEVVYIKEWGKIELSLYEVMALKKILADFCKNYETHILGRMTDRSFLHTSKKPIVRKIILGRE